MFKILILIFFNSTILSQNIDELFYEGNKFYSQNQFKKAIENYEKILDKNYFSEDLYLNLGNAYFKESNFGLARWSYEMGLILNPVSSDLKNNNNINKAYIEGYIELPNNKTIWEIEGNSKLTPDNNVKLVWKNKEWLTFEKIVQFK